MAAIFIAVQHVFHTNNLQDQVMANLALDQPSCLSWDAARALTRVLVNNGGNHGWDSIRP